MSQLARAGFYEYLLENSLASGRGTYSRYVLEW